MHFVSKIAETSARVPGLYQKHSRGFHLATYVDHAMGSVHMGAGICYLEPGGIVRPHLHSFEESFYILEGSVGAQIGEDTHELAPGNFGLIRTGVSHAWANRGPVSVKWLEMQAPQPRPAEYGQDTFFIGEGRESRRPGERPSGVRADRPIGAFDESQLPRPGTASQMEGFNPTTGVAIKMFVDRTFGAIHQSLFFIQYMPGARIDPHDHTFEESYLIVRGRVRATADGKTYDLDPGSVIWTSVGCIHSFANIGTEPVCWIETQAPLPPAQEVFRFERDWAKFSG